MNEAAHELALYTINCNWPFYEYDRRIRHAALVNKPVTVSKFFLNLSLKGAREYYREFGSGEEVFSPQDILAASIELLEYYEERAREARDSAVA